MAGKIFINYRRGDDPGNTGRLFDRLEEAFPRDQLFIDVDSVPPGRDFERVLEDTIAQCDVLLAVIGKGWLQARDEQGIRRLDKVDDFVRIEIASALKQDKLVIPVLVQDTPMPKPDELPEAIRPLARRNAVRLTHERFKTDTQGLVTGIKQALEEASAFRRAQAEAARKTGEKEEARRRALSKRQADELGRQEKQQARLAAVAGLSPEQIAKAEELANWDFIKASTSTQEFRDHLARFPGGVTERFARARLEDLVWTGLGAAPRLDQLSDFLAEFPQGAHAGAAADRRAALERRQTLAREASERERREIEAWAAASKVGDADALTEFINEWPQSRHVAEARSRIKAQSGAPTRRYLLLGGAVWLGAVGVAIGGGVLWFIQTGKPGRPPLS
jgi:hypothetical protein